MFKYYSIKTFLNLPKAIIMKNIPADFLHALKQKDYDTLKHILKFMPYETQWATNPVYSSYSEEDDMLYTYGPSDWTPLAEAAYDSNEQAIQLIIARWSNNAVDLITRTYRVLNQAEDYLQNSGAKHEAILDSNKIKQAKIVLRYQLATLIPLFESTYNETDHNAYVDYLIKQIVSVNKIDDLTKLYDLYIATHCISYQKVCLFFSNPFGTYSGSSIYLITRLHEKAYQLIKNQPDIIATENCQRLMQSTLFSEKHYQGGVLTQPIRNLINELSINASQPDSTLPVATAIFDDLFEEFEPSRRTDATLFSMLYNTSNCILNFITEQLYNLLTYFIGQQNSTSDDLYISYKSL